MDLQPEQILPLLQRCSVSDSATCTSSARRIDTHGATIYLIGSRAWKLKRAVHLAYLDFSTTELRRQALTNELTLNRRTAPDLYLALHSITRDEDGALKLDGAGETLDWVLEMRRFPDEALLSQLAEHGTLSTEILKALTDGIVAFHAKTADFTDIDGYTRFAEVIRGNIQSLEACVDQLGASPVAAIAEALLEALALAKPLLQSRALAGRVRHVHGDLHLANVALIDGKPTPFDCIEFDPEFAIIDTLYDLAFLVMDLWRRGMHRAANEVFNRYLDRSAIDEPGVALMPLFLATRAVVRAHVGAAQVQRAGTSAAGLVQARDYLQLALTLLQPSRPRLVAIGGLSGSGKSTLARQLAAELGRAPGARLLRSDVLRKRQAGELPETRLPSTAYTAEQSAQLYRHLAEAAATTLATGRAALVDAVFDRAEERARIAQLSREIGVPFHGIWLHCDEATRVARVEARRGDASDADAQVARAQSAYSLPDPDSWTDGWQAVDASGSTDQVLASIRKLLRESRCE